MLPHGCREVLQASAVHGLQAGSLHEDHQRHPLCAEASGLHGHPLRAASGVQASPGHDLLPGSLLPRSLRAELRMRRLNG